ncbi:hypothetical protein [Lactococcus lactis]|uniref:hypothetical protein n=1 Tax=Lactococcus lactis TaxID=1358 RepID=UPI0015C36A0A|nr:hypothetical protein [Lactococcus lactis]MCT0076710.1 hypothetical protein [Lactococcus lactis subsp. lactis]QLF89384.1 hypothetical protein HPC60_01055 [Lactococcus lactis subsp. lactis]
MIEKEMFKEIMRLFRDFNYQLSFYDDYRNNPTVDDLLVLAYSQLSASAGLMIMYYGERYRAAKDPESPRDSEILEKKTDEIFDEFVKFFDFYYKYRTYSTQYKEASFEDYLELNYKTNKSS